jgi:DNA-binding XRE family transcriptional regulator
MTSYFEATEIQIPLLQGDFVAKMRVNTKWFKRQMELNGLTQERVAKVLSVQVSTVSHLINGRRKMNPEYATHFSRLFGVPLEDILKNVGVETHGIVSKDSVKITGWVDAAGRVHKGTPNGPKNAPMPNWAGGNIKVLRYQTSGTHLEGLNGALLYYQETETVTPESIGKPCIVKLDNGEAYLGSLGRSEYPGQFLIRSLDGRILNESASVDSASPILWMKI